MFRQLGRARHVFTIQPASLLANLCLAVHAAPKPNAL